MVRTDRHTDRTPQLKTFKACATERYKLIVTGKVKVKFKVNINRSSYIGHCKAQTSHQNTGWKLCRYITYLMKTHTQIYRNSKCPKKHVKVDFGNVGVLTIVMLSEY